VRKEFGRQLAREFPVDADVVIPIPDSGVPAAIGYAEESGIRFETGLIRNHYVGRTFIEPQQSIRHFGVKLKLNPVREIIEGKRIVVIDDSIVRGTTSKQLVKLIREAEPEEVHFRVSSPPIRFPCYYGMDFPSREELIANQCNGDVEAIGRELGVDSLAYLSLERLLEAAPSEDGRQYCTACFSGKYPIPIDSEGSKNENDA